jgi:YidC/Oxa1 family membrane protein insertase
MDKNSVTGIILITLLTIGYFYFFTSTPPPEESPPPSSQITTTTPVDGQVAGISAATSEEGSTTTATDSLNQIMFGDFYPLMKGEAQTVAVLTDELSLEINTRGGAIEAAYLNGHKTHDSLPLPVVVPNQENEFFFTFPYLNRQINTKDLYFEPSATSVEVHGADSTVLSLRASLDEDRYLELLYTFRGEGFDLGYEIHMAGLKDGLGPSPTYDFQWLSHLPKTEYDIKNQRMKSSIVYRLGDDVEKMSPSDDRTDEKMEAVVEWVSFKSQFFSQILIAEEPLDNGDVVMTTPEDEQINRIMKATMVKRFEPTNNVRDRYLMYLGPNSYTVLKTYDLMLEDQLDMGWSLIAWINVATTYIFKFLEKYISSYGLIIILLSIMIRLLMLPLSYKSYISMAKMRVVNQTPEMKALDAKYKDDAQKLQMAKMGIYKEMGVSMFGGCLPMLLSYPFLIALFFFFPQSVELRQQSFLWANDLSSYDSILNLPFTIPLYGDHVSLFTILMAISTFVYTIFQQQSQPSTGANAQMKYIAYFMPVFLLVFLNSYAAGLSLYYFMSNLIQITQTTVIRRFFVNDEKILADLKATQKKKGKKGKGSKGGGGSTKTKSRLERWVENQQKKQQEVVKERKRQASPNRSGRRKK